MKKLSIMQSEILDQYFRCRDAVKAYENKIEKLPRGCISRKRINGREYYYLQFKEDGKVVSHYVKLQYLPKIEKDISKRKKYESCVKELKDSMRDAEKFLGRTLIDEYDSASGV